MLLKEIERDTKNLKDITNYTDIKNKVRLMIMVLEVRDILFLNFTFSLKDALLCDNTYIFLNWLVDPVKLCFPDYFSRRKENA